MESGGRSALIPHLPNCLLSTTATARTGRQEVRHPVGGTNRRHPPMGALSPRSLRPEGGAAPAFSALAGCTGGCTRLLRWIIGPRGPEAVGDGRGPCGEATEDGRWASGPGFGPCLCRSVALGARGLGAPHFLMRKQAQRVAGRPVGWSLVPPTHRRCEIVISGANIGVILIIGDKSKIQNSA